jgi:protein-S-isoprenylcysteine O-methyltransferase Ste14
MLSVTIESGYVPPAFVGQHACGGDHMQKYLSVLVLLLFFGIIGIRALMLRKKGIKAVVFAKTHKSDLWLLPLFPVFAYSVLACAFGLPMPRALIRPFWTSSAASWVGILLCTAALFGILMALIAFGGSFRIGIDDENPDWLVTGGVFSVSRNPIYVCFLLFFSGMLLIYPNIIFACLIIFIAPVIHRQILREEAFLTAQYKQEYEAYCARVRRYL